MKRLAGMLAVIVAAAACDADTGAPAQSDAQGGARESGRAAGTDAAPVDTKAERYLDLCLQADATEAQCRCQWRRLRELLDAQERDVLLILRDRGQSVGRALGELNTDQPGRAFGDLADAIISGLDDLDPLADSLGLSVPELLNVARTVAEVEARVRKVCTEQIRAL